MNFYEISATLENGSVHKTKIYEINQDRALNRASKFALQFDATGCAKKTVQLIQENAGVPKETERAFLNEIKEILEGLGPNSYCAMAFEGCVGDAEENIDNDFAVSMKGRWQSECKDHENTRKSLTEKLDAQGQRIAELEAGLQGVKQKLDWVSGHWQWGTSIADASDTSRNASFAKTTASGLSATAKLYLQAMAFLPEDGASDADYGNDVFWANNAAADRCACRGGGWGSGAGNGVFALGLDDPRSNRWAGVGGRLTCDEETEN